MTTLRRELARQGEGLRSYLETFSGLGIVLMDPARKIIDCNQGFARLFHLKQKPIGAPAEDFMTLGGRDFEEAGELKLPCSPSSGIHGILYCRAVEAGSGHLLFCERMILTESRAMEQVGAINNELINLQRESVKKNLLLEKMGRELDERITELEAALARVKQLEGIIPICMYCKKIRDDRNDWQRLEKYITDHSEAQFSHGICPTCMEVEMKKIKER